MNNIHTLPTNKEAKAMKNHLLALAAILTLSACAQPGQNRYGQADVGKASLVQFGTVMLTRPIEITGENHGIGAAAGAAGGAIAGSHIGNGTGSLAGTLAGALIAGIIGNAAEQAIADHAGIEFTVTLETGDTVTVVQNANPEEQALERGDRVVVQTSGQYMRVLPASHMPEEFAKPKGVKLKKSRKGK
jgi:outer membrane lipoprotein SlyB